MHLPRALLTLWLTIAVASAVIVPVRTRNPTVPLLSSTSRRAAPETPAAPTMPAAPTFPMEGGGFCEPMAEIKDRLKLYEKAMREKVNEDGSNAISKSGAQDLANYFEALAKVRQVEIKKQRKEAREAARQDKKRAKAQEKLEKKREKNREEREGKKRKREEKKRKREEKKREREEKKRKREEEKAENKTEKSVEEEDQRANEEDQRADEEDQRAEEEDERAEEEEVTADEFAEAFAEAEEEPETTDAAETAVATLQEEGSDQDDDDDMLCYTPELLALYYKVLVPYQDPNPSFPGQGVFLGAHEFIRPHQFEAAPEGVVVHTSLLPGVLRSNYAPCSHYYGCIYVDCYCCLHGWLGSGRRGFEYCADSIDVPSLNSNTVRDRECKVAFIKWWVISEPGEQMAERPCFHASRCDAWLWENTMDDLTDPNKCLCDSSPYKGMPGFSGFCVRESTDLVMSFEPTH